MNDEEFMQRFEDCTLSTDHFHHAGHVRMAWLYLQRFPLIEALSRFRDNLQRFAASLGKSHIYHETLTFAFVFLIHERIQRDGASQSWEEFASSNVDLLNWKESILKKYYSEDALKSDFARRVFVFPDRLPHVVEELALTAER